MDHAAVIKGYLYRVNETSMYLIGFKSLDTTNLINIDSKSFSSYPGFEVIGVSMISPDGLAIRPLIPASCLI